MSFDLATVWAGIIAFAVLAYVVLDGFDLGVGILFPFCKDEGDRDVMMNSVAPIWDGNETWLVLGGGGLFAVFPLAYSIVMPALYTPIIAMLLGLTFRGVAFEFRWRTRRGKFVWDFAFCAGSALAAFAQGVALGALVQGIAVKGRAYAGGSWDWLTPFSLLTGAAVTVGFALLGATWLVWKTSGDLQRRMHGVARLTGAATLLLIGLVSAWTPFLNPVYMQRWFAAPTIYFAWPVPVLVACCAFALFKSLESTRDAQAFLAALGLFVLSFIGIGISFYPYIVPPSVLISAAAAPENSMRFLLAGAAVLLPVILIYTAVSYWIFRGKVDPAGHYH